MGQVFPSHKMFPCRTLQKCVVGQFMGVICSFPVDVLFMDQGAHGQGFQGLEPMPMELLEILFR